MNGTIAAFGDSSDSADASGDLIHTSEDEVEMASSSDDDKPLALEIPSKPSKLSRVEKLCPFKCTEQGFIVCIYCFKAVINADGCKGHILKFHKNSASWLCPIEPSACATAMSMIQLQELYASHDHCRTPFDGIVIQNGLQCTGCSCTFLSTQTSKRHVKDCRKTKVNAMLLPVKCQQPLSWNNPRKGISFQKIFHVLRNSECHLSRRHLEAIPV